MRGWVCPVRGCHESVGFGAGRALATVFMEGRSKAFEQLLKFLLFGSIFPRFIGISGLSGISSLSEKQLS